MDWVKDESSQFLKGVGYSNVIYIEIYWTDKKKQERMDFDGAVTILYKYHITPKIPDLLFSYLTVKLPSKTRCKLM